MKKYRKQRVYICGKKQLVDVPVDEELYRADNHAEYQRARSKKKDILLQDSILADVCVDVMQDYEEKQLFKCLRESLESLTESERQMVTYLYYDELTEREVAEILNISHQAVNKQRQRIIKKLKIRMADWL